MNEEKMKILEMLEDGKISSAEALELLEALSRLEGKESRPAGRGGRFLKIRVYEENSPEAKVNVNIPIAWSKFMAPFIEQKIGQKLREKGYKMDVDKIREGDILEIDLSAGIIRNLMQGTTYKTQAFPEFLQEIVKQGGLMSWVKQSSGGTK